MPCQRRSLAPSLQLTVTWCSIVLVAGYWGCCTATDIDQVDLGFTFSRPEYTQHPQMARWLLHESSWGTISTISRHLGGMPFGSAVSFSDGPRNHSTGRLLFYLTTMDATAYDAQANDAATLSVCEAQLRKGCAGVDPEDPTCAKVSVSGRLKQVPLDLLAAAEKLLFARHPAMQDWPKGHAFQIYELHVEALRLLDFYGGAADITPDDYFAVKLTTAGRLNEDEPRLTTQVS